VTTHDCSPRADTDTDTTVASEQDVDVEVAYGTDVASHSYTGEVGDPAGADDVVAEAAPD
jgi:hypothetical protein